MPIIDRACEQIALGVAGAPQVDRIWGGIAENKRHLLALDEAEVCAYEATVDKERHIAAEREVKRR
jgi:hypothetical protein